ncbi:hypothetical protein, partial [Streptomyces aureus]|uniref:hypothetical protein n=1 Tax=Streptomyces aureus TaxID=193461 RepID=UPI0036B83A9B
MPGGIGENPGFVPMRLVMRLEPGGPLIERRQGQRLRTIKRDRNQLQGHGISWLSMGFRDGHPRSCPQSRWLVAWFVVRRHELTDESWAVIEPL